MGRDTAFIEIRAKPVLEEESGINAFGNPYAFRRTEQSYTYEVTTPSRRRVIELLLDSNPRLSVTRYSREPGAEDDKSRNPEDFTRMDSFSFYWGTGRPMTIDEIVDNYREPVVSVSQEKIWDRCFIEEFRDMLEKYKVVIEWNGKST
jgi:hypothetical protein